MNDLLGYLHFKGQSHLLTWNYGLGFQELINHPRGLGWTTVPLNSNFNFQSGEEAFLALEKYLDTLNWEERGDRQHFKLTCASLLVIFYFEKCSFCTFLSRTIRWISKCRLNHPFNYFYFIFNKWLLYIIIKLSILLF